jgi:hypothetical protein
MGSLPRRLLNSVRFRQYPNDSNQRMSRLVIDNQIHMSAPERIGRVRLSSNPKSSASATAPPIPMTTEVIVNPAHPLSNIFHPWDPRDQKDIQIKKPVTVAARNPARDFRGANLREGISGKWAGRGGVYFPQSLPIVEAVVSDHDRLAVSSYPNHRDRRLT